MNVGTQNTHTHFSHQPPKSLDMRGRSGSRITRDGTRPDLHTISSAALQRLQQQPSKFDKFAKESGKYVEALRKAVDASGRVVAAFNELTAESADAALGTNDVGIALHGVLDGFMQVGKMLTTWASTLQHTVVDPSKAVVAEYRSESEAMIAEYEDTRKKKEKAVKKAEKASSKLGAMVLKNKIDQSELTSSLNTVNDVIQDATQFEKDSLRKIVLAQRLRYCRLLKATAAPVVELLGFFEKQPELAAQAQAWDVVAETADELPLNIQALVSDDKMTFIDIGAGPSVADAGAGADADADATAYISGPHEPKRRGSIMHFGSSGMMLSDLQAHAGGMEFLESIGDDDGLGDVDGEVEAARDAAAATRIQAWWRGVQERIRMAGRGTMVRTAAHIHGLGAGTSSKKSKDYQIRKGNEVPMILPYWHDKYDDSTVSMDINAMSLEFLIRKITQPAARTDTLRKIVILTHTQFLPATRLMAYLELRFFSVPASTAQAQVDKFVANDQGPMQVATLQFLAQWLEQSPGEFPSHGSLASQVTAFLDRVTESDELAESVAAAAAAVKTLWASRLESDKLNVAMHLRDLGSLSSDSGSGSSSSSSSSDSDSDSNSGSDSGDGGASRTAAASKRRTSSSKAKRARRRTQARVTIYEAAQAPASLLLTSKPLHTMAQLHPLEVVRQLTLLDQEVFSRVQAHEFVGQAWARKGAELRAPYVMAMIKRFNDTVAWARTEVLKCDGPKYRARMICIMLDVASNCLALQNFNALMAVLSALEGAALARLRYTWELLPVEYESKLVDLKEVMSMSHNYRVYRDRLKSASGPLIPYIGVMLQDLTFIDDGNEGFVSRVDGAPLVNMEKHKMTFEVVSELLGYRDGPQHAFHPVPTIQTYLRAAAPKWGEDKCYTMSLDHEPRGMKPPPKGRRKKIVYSALEGSEVADFDLGRNARFLDDMMSRMSVLDANPGQVIVDQGDVGREMFFIAAGQVAIHLPSGTELALNQGSFFGEIALFLDTPRTATVVASTEVMCYVLSKKVLDEVLRSYPTIQSQFRQLAEARVAMNESDVNAELPAWMKKLAGRATVETVHRTLRRR